MNNETCRDMTKRGEVMCKLSYEANLVFEVILTVKFRAGFYDPCETMPHKPQVSLSTSKIHTLATNALDKKFRDSK
jgi:hypothetical protein